MMSGFILRFESVDQESRELVKDKMMLQHPVVWWWKGQEVQSA